MRLDNYLVSELGVETRSKALNLIKMGRVKVNGLIADKAGLDVGNKSVELLQKMEYPSMGAYKLIKALDEFNVSVKGVVACDIGASNGGFSAVLLERGAEKVYAVDVGECALPHELVDDSRVVIKDRTNARSLTAETLGEVVDFVTADVSFISLTSILQNISSILKVGGQAIILVKPQFEVGAKYLNKKGIVKDSKARENALKVVIESAKSNGLTALSYTTAPIYENKNIEYLLNLTKE